MAETQKKELTSVLKEWLEDKVLQDRASDHVAVALINYIEDLENMPETRGMISRKLAETYEAMEWELP